MKLILGNKNYSSWSLRGWLALRCAEIDFEEIVVPLYGDDSASRLAELSPNAKVPVLVEDKHITWDSLAILERANELAQTNGKSLWPEDPHARSHARSIAAEMHSGFLALRSECPMNIHRQPSALPSNAALDADVARLMQIVKETRETFVSSGPFLFGEFSAPDIFLAPVCWRLHSYQLAVDETTADYRDAVLAQPDMQDWQAAALAEPWVIKNSEI